MGGSNRKNMAKMMTVDELVASGTVPFCAKTIRKLIASGRLKATNVSAGSERPRWLIDPDDARKFVGKRI